MTIPQLFAAMPSRYRAGKVDRSMSYYFSIGDDKYTVKIEPNEVTVENGKTIENADVILKTTPELFIKMVVEGKAPGALDIARGKIKTNDPMGLQKLRSMFDFG